MAIKNSWASGEVLTAADLTDTFKGVFVNAQTGTSYTLGTADSFVSISNASGGTVTIPTNATAAFNTGAVVGIMNAGTAGTFTIGTAAGVTLNSTTGGTTLLPLETVYVVKLGTNTWQTKRDPGVANAGGLVYITGNTFSASSAVNVNNCFTSSYLAYRLILALSSSDGLGFTMRMRVGGADDTSTQYRVQQITADGATLTSVRPATGTSWSLGASANTELFTWDLIDPAVAAATRASHITSATVGGEPQLRIRYLIHSVSTAYDGFSLTPFTAGQTISGSVRVYGYRNS